VTGYPSLKSDVISLFLSFIGTLFDYGSKLNVPYITNSFLKSVLSQVWELSTPKNINYL
jgi:hypothetical protein